jgi:hypothetical protein
VVDNNIRSQFIDFIKENPFPDIDRVNAFSDELGIDLFEVYEEYFVIASTLFCGGDSVELKVDFNDLDKNQIDIGTNEIELEHVYKDNFYSKVISNKITLDHLSESLGKDNPRYNTMLLLMEKLLSLGITEDDIKKKFNIIEDNNIKENKMDKSLKKILKEAVNIKDFTQSKRYQDNDLDIINHAIDDYSYLLKKDLMYSLGELADEFVKIYTVYNEDNELIYKTLKKYNDIKLKVDGITGTVVLTY